MPNQPSRGNCRYFVSYGRADGWCYVRPSVIVLRAPVGAGEPDAIESVRPEVLRGDLACGWWEPGPVSSGGNADMDMFIPNN